MSEFNESSSVSRRTCPYRRRRCRAVAGADERRRGSAKMAQSAVKYQDSPKDGKQCDGCNLFVAPLLQDRRRRHLSIGVVRALGQEGGMTALSEYSILPACAPGRGKLHCFCSQIADALDPDSTPKMATILICLDSPHYTIRTSAAAYFSREKIRLRQSSNTTRGRRFASATETPRPSA